MLQILNTLTRKKEDFTPLNKERVAFYHCGPTVYWVQHIGNLRAATMADITRRTLSYLEYPVTLVRNYTDVGHLTSDGDTGEDRMEKGVKREKISPQEIADKYIKIFESDIHDLNIPDPDAKPKATEYISEMIEMVQTLLKKGIAYITPLAVYLDVTKIKDYGILRGYGIEDIKAGSGTGDVSDPEKKNSADFSVWFFKTGSHANALQYWESPFTSPLVEKGYGFPGWHIECSAMAKSLLGESIDLHMGGVEHIDTHHTNEIAQSEAANEKPFVKYWMHNEHLLINDQKMSKSDGNIITLEDIRQANIEPLVLRYFFLQAHYRSKQNFTWDALKAAETAYGRLIQKIKQLGNEPGEIITEYQQKFVEAIEDDFNMPKALAVVWDILRDDSHTDTNKKATIMDFDQVLGLRLAEKAILEDRKISNEDFPEEIKKLIEERNMARKNKDWKLSDELRDRLMQKGITSNDSDSSSTYSY